MVISNFTTKGDEPVSLFSVHRHSIRSPVFYPPGENTFLSAENFPRGPGYLTDTGVKRAIQVGKYYYTNSFGCLTDHIHQLSRRFNDCNYTIYRTLRILH